MPYPTPMRDATGAVNTYRPTPGTADAEPPQYPHPDAPITVNGKRDAGWGIHPCSRRPLEEWRAQYLESMGHSPEDDDAGHPISGDETTRLAHCQCWDDQINRQPDRKWFTGADPCEEPTCPFPRPHVAGQWFSRHTPDDDPRWTVPHFRDIAHVLYPAGIIPTPAGTALDEDEDDDARATPAPAPRAEPEQLDLLALI